MRFYIILAILIVSLVTSFYHKPAIGQEDNNYGSILSISGNTVEVQFEQQTLSVGDEILFTRYKEIVDPITGKIWGGNETEIAIGVVDDLGLGKAYVSIVSKLSIIENIELSDRAIFTGKGKKIVRTKKVVGKIQTLISEKEIEIDVGTNEKINDGDLFLIQRTENVYDPETNEITETKLIEVGKGQVSSVTRNSSRGEVTDLNPDMELNLETDNIVFEPVYAEPEVVAFVDSSEVMDLHNEINDLKVDVMSLRTAIDSLGQEHFKYKDELAAFKGEIENMFTSLMMSDIDDSKIIIKNDEPITQDMSENMAESYKQALDDCLNGRFERAVQEFQQIINRYPNSSLTENCIYWIAQSHFSTGNYSAALEEFKAVIEDTRFSHKDDDAALMLGITLYITGNNFEALEELKEFIIKYPDSEYRNKVDYWIQRLS